jgi:hypothetical protein
VCAFETLGVSTSLLVGAYHPTLKARLTALEAEKAAAQAKLAATTRAPVIRLHPKLPELYRAKMATLRAALNAPDTVTEAAEHLRGLIDRIVLTPIDRTLQIELHGDLAVLAGFAEGKERKKESAGSDDPARLSVVAGVRNHLYRTIIHAPRGTRPCDAMIQR